MKYQELKWRTKAMRTCGVKRTNLDSRYGAAARDYAAHSNPRSNNIRFLVAVLCALLIAPGDTWAYARSVHPDVAQQGQADSKIPNDQLDSLVAPVALYPDPLLAQVLAASTYPLELVQLQNWLGKHPDLKGQALADAVQNEDWDPSVQAMSAFPDLVKQLVDGIKWTTDLGNAFLAQQSDVMDAVQRMRKKAKDAGNLKSTEQQKVETKVVETKTVVVIEQANPQVVYVPSYNPVVVYGPPVYPYPPIYYPPPSYYAAGVAIAFGVGLAIGAAYHGGWGWGCGWGHSNVNINVNNNYVRHYNNTNINRGNINTGNINRPSTLPAGGGNNWQHNPQHRGGTPYSNRATATQYGGTARGDSAATRQANARQNQARQQPASMNRGGGGGNASTRPGGGGANASTRPAGGGASNMGANRGGSGGGDRVGNRQVPNTPSATNKNAFSGASSGMSGNAARTSNQRGASSMGASGGGAARSGGRKR
jgi:Protein of unknown function (DUF3300)